MADKLKFGLVGCGNIGKRHAELIRTFGILKAVCDNDSKKVNEYSKTYNVPGYTSFEIFLNSSKEIDVIVICTPNYLHAEQSIAALEKGYHVLCEKPMALNVKDCEKMTEAAKRNQKTLLIVKQNRFNPPVVYLKSLLDSKKLGAIYSISMNCLWNRNEAYYNTSNWKGSKELDGGILFTQFSHFFDVACWLFGEMHCRSASGKNFNHKEVTEFEDTVQALVTFEKGILGCMHFSTNAYETNLEGSLTIIAEKGSIIIGGAYLNEITHHQAVSKVWPVLGENKPANQYGSYTGSMSNHEDVYKHFLKSLKSEDFLYQDFATSLQTIKAIESVLQALPNSN